MDHAALLRYVVEISGASAWEQGVRTGEWLRKARGEGVDEDFLARLNTVTRVIEPSPASLVWGMVEEYFEESNAAPEIHDLEQDIREALQKGVVSEAVGGEALSFLGEVEGTVPRPESFEWALGKSREAHDRVVVTGKIFEATAFLNTDPRAAADILRTLSLNGAKSKGVSFKEGSAGRWKEYVRNRAGENTSRIMTGIQQFDYRVGGLSPGDLVVVSSRSSNGKSFTVCLLAKNMLAAGKLVVICTGEMERQQYLDRIEGLMVGVDPLHIRLGELMQNKEKEYRRSLLEWCELPGDIVIFDGLSGSRVSRLGDLVKETEDRYQRKVDALFVDPLYKFIPSHGSKGQLDWESVAAASIEMKALGHTHQLPNISTHQIIRPMAGEKSVGTEGLKYSDALGDECDIMVTIRKSTGARWTYRVPKNRGGEADWEFMLDVDLTRGMMVETNVPTGTRRAEWRRDEDDDDEEEEIL